MSQLQKLLVTLTCFLTLSSADLTETFYEGCSKTKGCQGFPGTCLETKDCTVAVSYQGISEDKYTFEIIGKASGQNKYVASGLSPKGSMSDSSVVACFLLNDKPQVLMTWNTGDNNIPLTDPALGISDTYIVQQDDLTYCNFTRNSLTQFSTPTSKPANVSFDLNYDEYTLIFATGPVSTTGALTYHIQRDKTETKISLVQYNSHFIPVYLGCSTKKGCFGFPQGCLQTRNCQIVSTFAGISADKYKFEIYGKADTETSSYVAVGLASVKGMAKASVIACSKFNDEMKVEMYWNEDTSIPLSNTELGLSNPTAQISNGYLYCTVVRDALTLIETPTDPSLKIDFDLNQSPYFVLLARGPLTDNGLLKQHSEKDVSQAPYSLSDYNSFYENIYNACGKTKGCVGYSKSLKNINDNEMNYSVEADDAGCIENKNCSILATYTGISAEKYTIEIYGKADSETSSYVAVGLSLSGNMTATSVIACSKFHENMTVEMYWNEGRSSKPLNNTLLGLSNPVIKYFNGFIYCSVTRDAFTQFQTPTTPSKEVEFEMNNIPYFVLLARGPLSTKGLLIKHSERAVTSEHLWLSDFNSFHENVYESCGKTKGCIGFSSTEAPFIYSNTNLFTRETNAECIISRNCSLIATYKGISADKYKIEIFGKADNETSSYIAIGLSSTNSMTKTSLVACSKFNDKTRVEMYWNEENSSKPLANPSLGLSNTTVEILNGFMYCSFLRDAVTEFETPTTPSTKVQFDLNIFPYFFLLARGPLNEEGLLFNHTENYVTSEKLWHSDFSSFYESPYDYCGTAKGCIGFSSPQTGSIMSHSEGTDNSDCLASKNCSILATYMGVSADQYKIEIFGKADNETSSYIALGISLSGSMTETSVVACSKFNDLQRVEMYWNEGHESKPLTDTSLGLSNSSVKHSGGYIYCSVIRKAITKIVTPFVPERQFDFDLNTTPYYILMVRGPLNDKGLLEQHTEGMVTDKKYNFLDFNSFNDNIYLGCGTSKGCYGYPSDCVSGQTCDFVATYSKLENDDIKFEISGGTSATNYLALGLANSEKMYAASVMVCYAWTDNNNGVALSWNVEEPGRNSVILADPTIGLKDVKVTFVDGKLKCTFVREKVTTFPIPTDNKRNATFDLSQKYHLLLAKGSIVAGDSGLGFFLQSHGGNVLGSADPVDLGSFSGVASATMKIVHWHGSLMIVAWLFLAVTGTMTARYGKSINAKVMGKDIWFRIHQVTSLRITYQKMV